MDFKQRSTEVRRCLKPTTEKRDSHARSRREKHNYNTNNKK